MPGPTPQRLSATGALPQAPRGYVISKAAIEPVSKRVAGVGDWAPAGKRASQKAATFWLMSRNLRIRRETKPGTLTVYGNLP